jgi:hypothetical protein
MTEYAWPAWALSSKERCQPHGDPGCPVCIPPIDLNEYRVDDPDDLEAAQNRYELTHIGWGDDTA